MQGLLKHLCLAVHFRNVERSEYNPGLWPNLFIPVSNLEPPPLFFLLKIASAVAVLLQKTYFSFPFFPCLSILLVKKQNKVFSHT